MSLGWHPLTLQSAASASGAHSAPSLPASQPAHPGPAGAGAAPHPPRCPPATGIGVRDPEGQGPACPTSWPTALQQGLTTRNTRGPSAALLSTRIHLLDMALLKPTLPLGSRWGEQGCSEGGTGTRAAVTPTHLLRPWLPQAPTMSSLWGRPSGGMLRNTRASWLPSWAISSPSAVNSQRLLERSSVSMICRKIGGHGKDRAQIQAPPCHSTGGARSLKPASHPSCTTPEQSDLPLPSLG